MDSSFHLGLALQVPNNSSSSTEKTSSCKFVSHFWARERSLSISSDQPDLALSKDQMKLFQGWQRPAYALPPPSWPPSSTVISSAPHVRSEKLIDLVQDVAADCSVVAGLCSVVARSELGHSRVLFSILWPNDQENMHANLSPNGKYVLKLNFNGCYRKVEIDDRLPVSTSERVLHVVDRNDPTLLWPALLEKAYLKVRGGYSFPGSNPSTDIWVILGWIPEQVFIQECVNLSGLMVCY